MKNVKKGYLYAILASIFFASIAILGKLVINTGLGPVQLMVWQYIFTGLTLLVYLWITDRKSLKLTRGQLFRVALQGIIGSAGTNFFFYAALQHLNAGICSLLLFTNPIFVVTFFMITGIKKIRLVNWIALGMAFGGSLLVLDIVHLAKGGIPLIGALLGLLSGMTYGFYNVFADLKLQDIPTNVVNFYASIFGILTAGGIGLFMGVTNYQINMEIIPLIFSISVIAGILPIVFIYKAIKIIGSEKVTVVATVELPITLLLAFLILGEKMNLLQIFGVILVIGATYILQKSEERMHKKSDENREICYNEVD